MARAQAAEPVTGTIKQLTPDRGFGFIKAQDGEYFFHRSAAPDFDTLKIGTAVVFVPTDGPKGPRAEDVTRLE